MASSLGASRPLPSWPNSRAEGRARWLSISKTAVPSLIKKTVRAAGLFSSECAESSWHFSHRLASQALAVLPDKASEVCSDAFTVDEVVASVREALALQRLLPGSLVKLTGDQSLLGMDGQVEFIFSSDGRFVEAFVGSQFACIAGFDGSNVWEGDVAGRVAVLDLDDYEVSLLTGWLKTGFWAHPAARARLEIKELDAKDWEYLQSLDPSVSVNLDPAQSRFLAVSLTGKKTTMFVSVATTDWLPTAAILNAYGTSAKAQLSAWAPVSSEVPMRVAMLTSLLRDTGDLVTTSTTVVNVVKLERDSSAPDLGGTSPEEESLLLATTIFPRPHIFDYPPSMSVRVPLDVYPVASLDSSAPPLVKALETSSGHILVRPLVNGLDVGYFILDTGASTFTIEPSVADKLGLAKFGCVNTVTVNGPAKCSFRDSNTFSLGPLHISNARFVDVAGASLAERSLPVVGICGYDVFCHCLVHLTRGVRGQDVVLTLLDPETPVEDWDFISNDHTVTWIPIRMLSSTPHIPIQFRFAANSEKHEALFLLDTGAAGSDLIFNSASTLEFGLWPRGKASGGGGIMRGMGSGGDGTKDGFVGPGMAVTHTTIEEVTICPGISVKKASAIVMAPEQNGLQLSCYTAGLICQNLLGDFDIVFDYRNDRIGLVIPGERHSDHGLQATNSAAAGG